jgi:hypothetical protein
MEYRHVWGGPREALWPHWSFRERYSSAGNITKPRYLTGVWARAAWRPARRPENTQSARDSPLT